MEKKTTTHESKRSTPIPNIYVIDSHTNNLEEVFTHQKALLHDERGALVLFAFPVRLVPKHQDRSENEMQRLRVKGHVVTQEAIKSALVLSMQGQNAEGQGCVSVGRQFRRQNTLHESTSKSAVSTFF